MSENNNKPTISENEINVILQNFHKDIENNSSSDGSNFNEIVMPEPIVCDERQAASVNNTNSGKPANTYSVIFNNSFTQKPTSARFDYSNVNALDADSPPLFGESSVDSEAISSRGKSGNYLPSDEIQNNEHKTVKKNKLPYKRYSVFKSVVFILLSLFLSVWLLSSGDKMSIMTGTQSEKDGMSVFGASSANLLSKSLDKVHKLPKTYLLEQNDEPAPVPNANNFSKIDDKERKNYDGSQIDYYKDETIEVKCWKEKIDGIIYNFSEVKIGHPSQFKRKLVDNVVSKKHLDYPLSIFKNTNGVVGMTSDYCAFRSYGTIVQFGKIIRDNIGANLDLLIYDNEGNLSSVTDKEFHSSEFFESDTVVFTFAFGPVLVNNYTVSFSNKLKKYPIGEVDINYPRAAIGQFGYDNHYLLCTVDYKGTTIARLAEVMQQKGCRFAYNLDGGQTSALMFNNKLFNVVAYGGQREVSDVIYFASAIPNK